MGAQKGTEFTYILYFLNAKNRLRQRAMARALVTKLSRNFPVIKRLERISRRWRKRAKR